MIYLVAILKVIGAIFYFNTNIYREVTAFKAIFGSGTCKEALVKYGLIFKMFGTRLMLKKYIYF